MNTKEKAEKWPVIYEAQDGTKLHLTKRGINITGVGVSGWKLRAMISLADMQDVLGTTEELMLELRMTTDSGIGNLVRVLRLIGYDITERNSLYEVTKRPEPFPPALEFLRNPQISWPALSPESNGQLTLGIQEYEGPCTYEKLAYPQAPPHSPVRSNIMISQRDWEIYQAKIEKLYEEYCLFVDIFNNE